MECAVVEVVRRRRLRAKDDEAEHAREGDEDERGPAQLSRRRRLRSLPYPVHTWHVPGTGVQLGLGFRPLRWGLRPLAYLVHTWHVPGTGVQVGLGFPPLRWG